MHCLCSSGLRHVCPSESTVCVRCRSPSQPWSWLKVELLAYDIAVGRHRSRCCGVSPQQPGRGTPGVPQRQGSLIPKRWCKPSLRLCSPGGSRYEREERHLLPLYPGMLQLAHRIGHCTDMVSLTALALECADGMGDLGLVLRLPVTEKPKGRRRALRVAGDPRTGETSI